MDRQTWGLGLGAWFGHLTLRRVKTQLKNFGGLDFERVGLVYCLLAMRRNACLCKLKALSREWLLCQGHRWPTYASVWCGLQSHSKKCLQQNTLCSSLSSFSLIRVRSSWEE